MNLLTTLRFSILLPAMIVALLLVSKEIPTL